MAKVSLTVIHRQEWEHLTRLAESVKNVFSEIIFCNTDPNPTIDPEVFRSVGKTCNIPWRYDFSHARNFVACSASERLLSWMDSDDFIKPDEWADFIDNLEDRIGRNPETTIVHLPYVLLDRAGNEIMRYHRERIFPKGKGQWVGAVHECWTRAEGARLVDVYLNGPVVYHQPLYRIEGHSTRNLDILERELQKGPLDWRLRYYYSQELYDHGRFQDAALSILSHVKDIPEGSWYEREAWRLAGDGLYQSGNTKAAGICYQTAVEVMPDGMSLHALLNYYYKERQWQKLIDTCSHYSKALTVKIEGFALSGCSTWRIYDMLSLALIHLGQLHAAKDKAKYALLFRPPEPHKSRIEANLAYIKKIIVDTKK